MKAVFADTFYFLALLNERDLAHRRAVEASRLTGHSLLVTTEFVLLELGDALSKPSLREEFWAICSLIGCSPSFRVEPASSTLFRRGLELHRSRPDQDWQLTDCISFVVMRDAGITDALTGDRHFEQAGFTALLK